MKLLLVTPFLPHPGARHGGAVVTYQLLRELARRHQVSLVSFTWSEEDEAAVAGLGYLCPQVATVPRRLTAAAKLRARFSLLSPLPFEVALWRSGALRQQVAQLSAQPPDLVQVEFSQMAQYGEAIAQGRPTLLHLIDVASQPAYREYRRAGGLRRAYKLVEWQKMRRYEAAVARRFGAVVTVSAEDQELLAKDGGASVVIPHAVDADYWEQVKPRWDGATLVFVGAFWREANLDGLRYFHDQVWPRIRAAHPEVRLLVVGDAPSAEVRALSGGGVEVRGFVPDLRAALSEATIFVAPLRLGGGIKIKVLEAMAAGLPVVSTPVGVEGIRGQPGEHFLVATTAQELAAAVVGLLDDELGRRRLGRAAQALVRQGYSWPAVISQWEALYQRMAADKAAEERAPTEKGRRG